MPNYQHPNSLEKVGIGLTSSVETFRGCNIQIVRRTSGFNGLSTNKDGEVRKIEVKTMSKSFNWIAISSVTAIDKLFFERDYWLYFVLLPNNYVVMTKGLLFIQQQLSLSMKKNDFLTDLEAWMKLTRHLKRKSGLKFLPKLQIKFPIPLRLSKKSSRCHCEAFFAEAIPRSELKLSRLLRWKTLAMTDFILFRQSR